MKKYRICAIFAMIFIVCAFVGCQNQENNTVTKEQVLQALQSNGFEDAHINSIYVYIDADEKTSIWFGDFSIQIFFDSDSELNSDSNIAELLNAIMLLYDVDFHNAGNYILKEINENFSDYRGHLETIAYTKYHDYKYEKYVNDISRETKLFTVWIK